MMNRERRPLSLSGWSYAGLLMIVGLSMVLTTTPAGAHFLLNLNVRILHVEHLADGVRVYLRTPMPYLVADRVGPVGANGLPEPAPYTTNRMEDGRLVHYLEPSALRSDPEGLGRLAAEGFQLERDGERLEATVERVRAYPVGTQPPFATLDEARTAFETRTVFPADVERAYVGDVVVDIILRYRTGGPVYDYSVSSSLDPGLPDQENTANLILDYSPGAIRVFKEGVRHILEGYDHVLFIICLTLGATRLTSLVWRATGFTIGHSVALIAGFFGFVPSGQWFIPTVETGIALSIIYAAALAVMSRRNENRGEVQMLYITTAIGLLHGFGFSFVLHELLKVDSPDIWQSLLAFNVGVEIGQLLIISVAWMVFRSIARMNDRAWLLGRWGIAASCAMVALFWTVQRVSLIVDTI